jgi:hypothetical protein
MRMLNRHSRMLGGALAAGVLALMATFIGQTATLEAQKKPKNVTICPDYKDWVYDGSEWTLTGDNPLGTKKFDVDGDLNHLFVSAPSGYEIVSYCVKAGAGTDAAQFFPLETPSPTYEISWEGGKDVSHFSVTLREVLEDVGEWCSPGFWRNNYNKHAASAWPPDITGVYFYAETGADRPALKQNAPPNPTIIEVLDAPNTYGGGAFNWVGTFLSLEAGLNVQFDANGTPIHNCPLDQQGSTEGE